MRNIQTVSAAVAAACAGSRKFTATEHAAAMGIIAATSAPAELIDNLTSIGNISAVRQDLELGGVLPTTRQASAFAKAVVAIIGTHDAPISAPAAAPVAPPTPDAKNAAKK